MLNAYLISEVTFLRAKMGNRLTLLRRTILEDFPVNFLFCNRIIIVSEFQRGWLRKTEIRFHHSKCNSKQIFLANSRLRECPSLCRHSRKCLRKWPQFTQQITENPCVPCCAFVSPCQFDG